MRFVYMYLYDTCECTCTLIQTDLLRKEVPFDLHMPIQWTTGKWDTL